ncbi:phospho-N-acetylmuramoyl-pentapeptide-transferase [Kallipyga massiliensis]|uniref:phospho-N-acetylmuramoyl-pentapeptide- transferase n=1 Tax=Kallipyga massiliensis TaxID=1472764 RepID=UPI0004BAC341|nr:phospho-N-acetylmuramoyl-pentapeptide-transferase [Kallipyga massiliensis]
MELQYPGLLTFFLATLFSGLGTYFWIRFSRKKAIGQPIREEGNKAHYKKAGTPTMGGIVFTLVSLVLLFVFTGFRPESLFLLLGTLGFALIGFLDDYEKVKQKQNEGLTPRQKLYLQFGLSFILVSLAFLVNGDLARQKIPFFNVTLDLGLFWVPILMFVVVGSVNAVNLTDGLDGLCTGVSIPIFLALALAALIYPYAVSNVIYYYALIFAGALVGYLFFNAHPASVMMGDTGSMAIGGAIVSLLLLYNRLLFMVVLGGVYLMEALSVIIQVTYFKRTGGKRIFKMSPIHHHFELSGYPEEKITIAFSLVSLLLSLLTLSIF